MVYDLKKWINLPITHCSHFHNLILRAFSLFARQDSFSSVFLLFLLIKDVFVLYFLLFYFNIFRTDTSVFVFNLSFENLMWHIFLLISTNYLMFQFVPECSMFQFLLTPNRPFPSSLVPLCQKESKRKTFLMKMTLICMKMKLHSELIFIWKVSHIASFWNRGTRELGNGLLNTRAKRPRMCKVSIFKLAVANANFTQECLFLS